MHSGNHPLKKSYDRKCVPVRRVSAWEREQIEKRQKHLKEFKGEKWQRLHREDELRKAKAAADGVRYVRLSSVRSASTAPNRVSRVAARRTRGVRFPARKNSPHKLREQLTSRSTKTRTHNKIAPTTYHPAPKLYRFRRPPPPPTPFTFENLKRFIMEEKRGRKGNDDDDDDDDEFEKAAVAKLFKLIAEDGRSDILRYQVRIIKKLRKSLPPQQTNPKLERAEGELFQLIEDRRSLSDIEIKAGIVQGLKAELAIAATLAAGRDTPEHSKPSKPDHGYGREATAPSAAPVPAEEDSGERSKPIQPEHGNRQEDKRSKTSLDASARHKHPPKAQASASSVGDPLDPPSPPGHATRPVLEPKPAYILSQENRRSETSLEASKGHKQVPKPQKSASSVGDPLDPPSPPRRDRQSLFVPQSPEDQRQEKTRPRAPFDVNTRHKRPPESIASASSIGDRFDPPSPLPPAVPTLRPYLGQRQETPRPRTAPGATTHTNKRPQSRASGFFGRFERPSSSHRDRQPTFEPRPSQGHRQETPRPSTAPSSFTRAPKRPQSRASNSSFGSRSELPPRSQAPRPSPPPRGRPRTHTSTPHPPAKRRRAATPPSPEHYLPEDSPSPPRRAPGIAPRPRFKAKSSITDREDKASRALMHPASAPLAKLQPFVREETEDFEKVGRLQKVHPTFEKARRMGNANLKHVRLVNRTSGRRKEEEVVERSVWDRIGMVGGGGGLEGRGECEGGRGGGREVGLGDLAARVGEVELAGGAGGAGQMQGGQAMAELAGLDARGEVAEGQTIEELIAAEYGRSEAGGEDGL